MNGYYAIEPQNEMGLSKVLYKTPCGIIVEVATVYLVGEDEINAKDIVQTITRAKFLKVDIITAIRLKVKVAIQYYLLKSHNPGFLLSMTLFEAY